MRSLDIMIVLSLLAFIITNAEARVYCQDRHATGWRSLGHACTITCNTVLGAIEKLKQNDYQQLVNEHGLHRRDRANRTSNIYIEIIREGRRDLAATEIYEQTYEAFMKIIPTEKFLSDFKSQLVNVTSVLNMTCYVTSNRSRLLRKILNDCTAHHIPKGYIYKNFIEFLNHYAHKENPFDATMTLIILKHLLNNVNIRYGDMMESVVLFLQRELRPRKSRMMMSKKGSITLGAKDCMSVFLPGCFCVKGYVEDDGRCVKPEKCSEDPVFFEYFKRVKVQTN